MSRQRTLFEADEQGLIKLTSPRRGRRIKHMYRDEDGRLYRRCHLCKQVVPLDEYGPMASDRKYKKARLCIPCTRVDARARHAEKRNERYGVTSQQLEEMKERQGGRCAICRKYSTRTLHLDHCHATGRMREFLCQNCNLALGYVCDDESILLSCIEYLRKHNARLRDAPQTSPA